MRTSRVSKDAAKIATLTSRRTTRSQLSNSSSTSTLKNGARQAKQASTNVADRSPSSSLSPAPSMDIEDFAVSKSSSLKRKRGKPTPSTTVPSNSTRVSTRNTPRKSNLRANGIGKDTKSEVKEEYELDEKLSERTRLPKAKPQPAKKVTDPDTGEVKVYPPLNWEEIYDTVKKMRKTLVAPVDTMGCERAADIALSEKDQRFQTLIALMLSSQTKDTTLFPVMQKLKTTLPAPGLTLTNILALTPTPDVLNNLIWAVGFHNNKTRYILQTAAILRDKHDGDIPRTAVELMTLPGVGPKMAYLCMSAAWGVTEGIGVDVHVHRITNMWGWHKTNDPEGTRKELEAWLPRDKWREINWLLVGLGQTVCTPVGRKCGECELSGRGLCAGEVVDRKVKVVKKEVAGEERVKVEEVDRTVNGEKEVVVKEEVISKA